MPRKKWKYIVLVIILVPLIAIGFTAGYFLNKIWQVSRVITLSSQMTELNQPVQSDEGAPPSPDNSDVAPANNQVDDATKQEYKRQYGLLDFAKEKTLPSKGTKDRINILILGKAVPNYPGADLTDTIILASIDPQTYESSLMSIPRDLLVKIPGTNQVTKINAIYVYGLKMGGQQKGIELLEQVISDVTGQPVDYYVMVNFTAFQQAVDALGGVDVNVPNDIYDNRYPGQNYSYETFQINKGPHHLDGATALQYVRVRHGSGGGDFGRAQRQQQVIEAAKDKFFAQRGLTESLDFFNNMLKIVQDNVKTDIGFGDYFPFLFLLKDINIHQVVNKVLDNTPDGLLEDSHPVIGGITAYALLPRAGDYYEIRKLASYIFHLDEMQRQDQARKAENATVAIVAAPQLGGYVTRVQKILNDQGYQTETNFGPPDTVYLLERQNGASLPVLSQANRQSVSSDSSIETQQVSPDNLDQTVIYDNSEGSKPFSLDDLTRRLSAQVSLYKDDQINADFVVILGSNTDQLFQKEEGNLFLTDQGIEEEKMENGQPAN